MLISTASFAAAVVMAVAGLIWWSNPTRKVNRVILGCSCVVAAWLACLHVASQVYGRHNPAPAGITWLRMACAVGAWLPTGLWVTKETIAAAGMTIWSARGRALAGWIVFSLLVGGLCFTGYFIPLASNPRAYTHGQGYNVYIALIFGAYFLVLFQTLRDVRSLAGGPRLELQVWLIGSWAMVMAVMITMILHALTNNPIYIRLQPLFVLGFYGGAVYAITSYRIFDAQQILRLVWSRLFLGAAAIGLGFLVVFAVQSALTQTEAMVCAGIAVVAAVLVLRPLVDRLFEFYPQAREARRAALEVASREVGFVRLEERFVDILKGWGQSDNGLLLVGRDTGLRGGGMELPSDDPVAAGLRLLNWATPERLARERQGPMAQALADFLRTHRLGIVARAEGPALSVIVGAGIPMSRRPFTYPQAMQLMELAAIFLGPLERASLADKMQHAEQLATVGMLGASLAHEIRNPLVSLKAFVQLFPSRYQEAAFREKFFRLMTDEVKRIDRLTEQLLDLASPHVYSAQPIELHAIVRAGLELVTPRAAEGNVAIVTELNAASDRAMSDPAAVKQVLLNLCLNAIQVLEGKADRRIMVATFNGPGVVELTVTDTGPGISPEMRNRLFQPFQSTKSSGFGLGLAICRDILAGLDATIAAEPPQPGKGASFRITFPCLP